jgi:branched-chain amino acid aminotransferase
MIKNSEFIVHNGNFISKSDFNINPTNRAFRYGDGVFETLFVSSGKIHFFEEHFARLSKATKILKMSVPAKINFESERIKENILSLLRKNKQFTGAKIRISVFRTGAGLYTPETNDFEYLIESESLNRNKYELNQFGLRLGAYRDITKDPNLISGFKNGSALIYVLAGIYCKTGNYDDCLIFNSKSNIIESVSSNIFFVKNDELFTPPISEGCIDGVMRKQVIRLALENQIAVHSENPISEKDFYQADEVFLTNAVSGIRWAISYGERRFYNKTSVKLLNLLNIGIFQT